MKRSIYTNLSILCLSLAVTTAVRAETNPETVVRNTIPKVTPFELVSLAYQGKYQNQGIPGFNSFLFDYYTNAITPQDLVKAAIATKDLDPETLTDRGYLHAIEIQLLGGAE